MSKKIAFIKSGSYSGVNSVVENILSRAFPHHQVEVIDIKTILSPYAPVNLLYCILEYGNRITFSRDRLIYYATRTSYYTRNVRRKVQEILRKDEYLFSFQTQSLFNLSVPEVPHFIYTDHCHLAPRQNQLIEDYAFLPDWWIKQEKDMYRQAIQVLTMSPNIDRALIELYRCPPEKIACIYAGSLIREWDTHFHINLQKYRQKTVLFVGAQWKLKGGALLYKAFKEVVKKVHDAQLVIIGANPRIFHPNVRVLGTVSPDELRHWLNQSSVFCMPTQREPFSISFLDALAYQLPIVMSHSGVEPTFIYEGKNGYALLNGDIQSLTDKLIYLLEHPDVCREMGQAGYKLFQETYNWQKVETALVENIQSKLYSSQESLRSPVKRIN